MAWPALAQENLVCIANKSTGFAWNGSDWVSTDFRIDQKKYMVKSVPVYSTSEGQVNFEVSEFGNDFPSHRCFKTKESDAMACGGLGWGFVMNFKMLRFQEYYGIGYVHGPDQPGNTPALTIGTCAKM
jgi:hypothetical protein